LLTLRNRFFCKLKQKYLEYLKNFTDCNHRKLSIIELNSKLKIQIELYSNLKDIQKIVNSVKVFLEENKKINTFEKARHKLIIDTFKNIYELVELFANLCIKFDNPESNKNFEKRIDDIIVDCIARLKKYLEEPFCYFPDASLWLLFNDKPVGVCTLKSEDIIWSSDEYKRGIISAKKVYTDIKSLNPNDFDHPERENIARIRTFFSLLHESQLDEFLENKLILDELGKEHLSSREKRTDFKNFIPKEISLNGS
jgi:hypothetical protein